MHGKYLATSSVEVTSRLGAARRRDTRWCALRGEKKQRRKREHGVYRLTNEDGMRETGIPGTTTDPSRPRPRSLLGTAQLSLAANYYYYCLGR